MTKYKHEHTEQLHVERVMSMKSLETRINSYCLSCGEKVYETTLKKE